MSIVDDLENAAIQQSELLNDFLENTENDIIEDEEDINEGIGENNKNENDKENNDSAIDISGQEDYEIGAFEIHAYDDYDDDATLDNNAPKLDQWKEEKLENQPITLTVAKTCHWLWSRAIEEIKIIKKMLQG